jgi:acyl-CoA synthetase (AMP-forming)/AMP-acid ligase II
MIITGGENVFPAEIESFLQAVPAIENVVVLGVASDNWGEEVTAVVVPAVGHTVTDATLVAALVGNVARFKIPRALHVVDELPLASTGKVDREALRAMLSNDSVNRTSTL